MQPEALWLMKTREKIISACDDFLNAENFLFLLLLNFNCYRDRIELDTKICSLEGYEKFIEALREAETFVNSRKIQSVAVKRASIQLWRWRTIPTSILLTFWLEKFGRAGESFIIQLWRIWICWIRAIFEGFSSNSTLITLLKFELWKQNRTAAKMQVFLFLKKKN